MLDWHSLRRVTWSPFSWLMMPMFCLSRLSLRVSVSREQEIEPSVEPWQRGEVKTIAGARRARAGSSEGYEPCKERNKAPEQERKF